MRRFERGVRLVALLLVWVVVFAACDGGDDEPDVSDTEAPREKEVSLDVSAEDNSFDPDEIEVDADTDELRIAFTNNGSNRHTFTIEGLIDSGEVGPGETLNLIFPPPEETTEFFCTIHGSSGMTGRLIVEDG